VFLLRILLPLARSSHRIQLPPKGIWIVLKFCNRILSPQLTADGERSALDYFHIIPMNLVEHLDLTPLVVRDTFLAETTDQRLDSLSLDVIEAHTRLSLGFDLHTNL